MAVIGNVLTSPEAGWVRYDNVDPSIKFTGGWVHSGHSAWHQGTYSMGNPTDSYKFKFVGTKFRIISYVSSGLSSRILVDGVEYNTTEYTSATYIALAFELTGLEQGAHTVEVIGTGITSTYLDAIDLGEGDYFSHPILDEVFNLGDLEVGKCIRCNYKAGADSVGKFTALGHKYGELIPAISSDTPDGDFYFIMVGYDHLGRKKLVADRNIQHSISWDNLNNAGVVFGVSVNIDLITEFSFTTRLLSGGATASAGDTSNEWDKIIVESNLGGSITQGDNSVWNWDVAVYSWVSNTVSTDSVKRYRRGGSVAIDKRYSTTSSYTGSYGGYRPVLLVESLNSPPTITGELVPDGVYLYEGDTVNFGTVSVGDEDGNDVAYSIELNGAELVAQSAFSAPPLVTSGFSVTYADLTDGGNTVQVVAEDSMGGKATASATIVKDALTQEAFVRSTSRAYAWSITDSGGKDVFTTLSTTAIPMKYRTGIASLSLGSATDVKVLVSVDGRTTWKAYTGGSWNTVLPENIGTGGMTKAEAEALTTEWAEIFTTAQRVDFMLLDNGADLSSLTLTFEANVAPQITENTINSNLVGYYDTVLNATITKEGQDMRYRVVVNKGTENEVAGAWSDWVTAPIAFNATYTASDFVDGDNTIDVETIDYFGATSSWQETVSMSVHDTIITIDNPTDTVPKDTAYNFTFRIEPAFYGTSIDKTYDGGAGVTEGSGKVYTISVDKTVMKDKDFNTITLT